MSNVIAVMSGGKIVQEGSPREIYLQPKSKFVANFIGSTNQLSGRLVRLEGNGTGVVATDHGEIACALSSDLQPGSDVVVVARPETVVLHKQPPGSLHNILEGKIGAAMFLGEYLDCTIELGRNLLQTHQPHSMEVHRGDRVWVELPPGDCMALPAE
jgi:ABC-type Fe3+/spermidine/putrescine transport system ATPase subunit